MSDYIKKIAIKIIMQKEESNQKKGLFYVNHIPKFIKLRISESQIPRSGNGCYAEEPIPKNAYGIYRGTMYKTVNSDTVYAWMIEDYSRKTGEPINGKTIGYLDGKLVGNWSKWVNCGRTSEENNMIAEQRFGKIYYKALRDIKPGEELFIDYGEGFRKELGIEYGSS